LLLHKDAELTEARVGQVIRGMELSMQATGATEGIFPIKALMQKLGVKGYDVPAPLVEIDYDAKRVNMLLTRSICSGKFMVMVGGNVAGVQAAVDAGAGLVAEKGLLVNRVVIPRPHKSLLNEMV
jgi:hypothetical protein